MKRLVGLDYFRISAALVTFLFHSIIHLGVNYGYLQNFLSMGAVMMTGFFMLSGITLYFVYSKIDLLDVEQLAGYFKKRLVGIFPVYLFTILIYILILSKETMIENIVLFPIEVAGIQSCFSSLFPFSHNGGTWFVSCLLICYILFPYVMYLSKQISAKIKVIWLVISVGVLFYSPIVVSFFSLSWIYTNPFFRFLEFLCGVLIGAILSDKHFCIPSFFKTRIAVFFEITIMILGVSIAVDKGISVGNYMLYSWICLPIFIMIFLALVNIDMKERRVVQYCSSICYEFFLVQFFVWPICRIFINKINMSNLATIILSLLICLILSILCHETIQKPCKRFFLLRGKKIK